MTPIPAKVLTVDKQSSQYRVLVQIELDKYLGSFHTLRFGEKLPFTGSCHNGQLDLFTIEIQALKQVSRSRSGRLCDVSHASAGGSRDAKILALRLRREYFQGKELAFEKLFKFLTREKYCAFIALCDDGSLWLYHGS